MRGGLSSLIRWLTEAVFGSIRPYFRREQAEFPVTHPSACNLLYGPLPGWCAAGRASIDALRCTNNSVNIEDQHEISFIREATAAFARRLSAEGRAFSSARDPRQHAKENLVAAVCGVFYQR